MKSILGNIEFLFKSSAKGRLAEAMLYYKLRLYGEGRGGYLDGYEFSKNERYNLLPRLERFGWVVSFRAKKGEKKQYKLTSHRKVACKGLNTHYNIEYSAEEVSNMETFKAWIVSLAEEYSIIKNYKKQNDKNKWYSARDRQWIPEQVNGELLNKFKTKKFNKENQEVLSGRVSNSLVGGLLGVSDRTVSSWRSAPFEWKSRKGKDGWYKRMEGFNVYYLRNCYGDVFDENVSFNSKGEPFKMDMKVHVNRRIFTHKYSKGIYGFGG